MLKYGEKNFVDDNENVLKGIKRLEVDTRVVDERPRPKYMMIKSWTLRLTLTIIEGNLLLKR